MKSAVPILAIGLVGAIAYWFLFDQYPRGAWREQGQYNGTIVGLTSGFSKSGVSRPSRLIAKLENGVVVTLYDSDRMLFEKGRRVLVVLRVSEENQRQRYHFIAYLDSE